MAESSPRVWKLSGAGNDFIAVLAEEVESDERVISERAVAWCRRGLSLGADGLLVLAPLETGRARLVYYNADGSRGELCLNGSRCAARLALELGWGASDGRTVTLATDAGSLSCRAVDPGERLQVGLPRGLATVPWRVRLGVDGPFDRGIEHSIDAWRLTVGVPHLVVDWPAERFADLPIESLGPALRSHPELGPGGANVDFIHIVDRHTLWLRTFERGVEAETLACGTGVVAAAVVGFECGRLEPPVVARTAGGYDLELSIDDDATVANWPAASLRLAGDARLVAAGRLLPAALAVPAAPRWIEVEG